MAALGGNVTNHQLALVSLGLDGSPPYLTEAADVYLDGASMYEALLTAVGNARDHIISSTTSGARHDRHAVARRVDRACARRRDGAHDRRCRGRQPPRQEVPATLREAASSSLVQPITLISIRRRRADFRTHRKIVVIDGRLGFVGGMNIADVQSSKLSEAYWRDTHLQITGPAVWPLQRMFFEDWNFVADELLPVTLATVPAPTSEGDHLVQVLGSGTRLHRLRDPQGLLTATPRRAQGVAHHARLRSRRQLDSRQC